MDSTVVELRSVTFRRGNRTILDAVDLTVRAGEHWALLGPNGAGKSTILGFAAAVTHPTSGSVQILGQRLGRVELQALRRSIGHVNPRHPLQSPLTIRDLVLTGLTGSIETPPRWEPTLKQIQLAAELINQMGLTGKDGDRWPTLSQGERGRALIARALIAEPDLLLLDEPTTGLDVAAREQLLETIDALEHDFPRLASILVTHHLEELPSTTSHAALIAQGRIFKAGLAEQVLTTENVTAAFAHPIRVGQHDGRWFALPGRKRSRELTRF
ncbi:ATP-binding cassette domain-containing protein [Cryobacterium sp. PH29-G1]|uniref:ABC transporter ATP-binding protein n=1 Tax=Cryobacterium sp. PH29-G1 TaxID=3046211 RepID=UPI0024BB1D0A|nr:ATP-binding cassette domain-containing protein [Cryobacterium sp. PH29-G1]MDJ0349970.1 ATP-binding cassette domain-containing protein [Cryobacterium sp. PH29-G1]